MEVRSDATHTVIERVFLTLLGGESLRIDVVIDIAKLWIFNRHIAELLGCERVVGRSCGKSSIEWHLTTNKE